MWRCVLVWVILSDSLLLFICIIVTVTSHLHWDFIIIIIVTFFYSLKSHQGVYLSTDAINGCQVELLNVRSAESTVRSMLFSGTYHSLLKVLNWKNRTKGERNPWKLVNTGRTWSLYSEKNPHNSEHTMTFLMSYSTTQIIYLSTEIIYVLTMLSCQYCHP